MLEFKSKHRQVDFIVGEKLKSSLANPSAAIIYHAASAITVVLFLIVFISFLCLRRVRCAARTVVIETPATSLSSVPAAHASSAPNGISSSSPPTATTWRDRRPFLNVQTDIQPPGAGGANDIIYIR